MTAYKTSDLNLFGIKTSTAPLLNRFVKVPSVPGRVAKEACKDSGFIEEYHFADVGKMIELAKTVQREIDDVMLSRYACYLIVQNADPRKEVVARDKPTLRFKRATFIRLPHPIYPPPRRWTPIYSSKAV